MTAINIHNMVESDKILTVQKKRHKILAGKRTPNQRYLEREESNPHHSAAGQLVPQIKEKRTDTQTGPSGCSGYFRNFP